MRRNAKIILCCCLLALLIVLQSFFRNGGALQHSSLPSEGSDQSTMSSPTFKGTLHMLTKSDTIEIVEKEGTSNPQSTLHMKQIVSNQDLETTILPSIHTDTKDAVSDKSHYAGPPPPSKSITPSLYYFPKATVAEDWKQRVNKLFKDIVQLHTQSEPKKKANNAVTTEWVHSQHHQTVLHFQSAAVEGPTRTPTGKAVRFVVCVRDWLYDYLAAQYGPMSTPYQRQPTLRHRMGELRTWSALLAALTSTYGCDVHLTSHCKDVLGNEQHLQETETVLLVEDLSLSAALQSTNERQQCQQWSLRTLAVAGEESKVAPPSRTFTLFYTPSSAGRSLGFVAECKAPTTGVPHKGWYALLWGKTKQYGKQVDQTINAIQKYIPVFSSCIDRCGAELNAANLFPISSDNISATPTAIGGTFGSLLASAVMLVGPRAPNVGATVPEALACGTFVIARGRSFGYEFASHPLTRRIISKQSSAIVLELDRHVRDVLSQFGFDFRFPFDQQPHPPNITSAYTHFNMADLRSDKHSNRFLPHRYSVKGYADHVGTLLGLEQGRCRMNASLNEAGTITALLDRSRKSRWVFEGCEKLPHST